MAFCTKSNMLNAQSSLLFWNPFISQIFPLLLLLTLQIQNKLSINVWQIKQESVDELLLLDQIIIGLCLFVCPFTRIPWYLEFWFHFEQNRVFFDMGKINTVPSNNARMSWNSYGIRIWHYFIHSCVETEENAFTCIFNIFLKFDFWWV